MFAAGSQDPIAHGCCHPTRRSEVVVVPSIQDCLRTTVGERSSTDAPSTRRRSMRCRRRVRPREVASGDCGVGPGEAPHDGEARPALAARTREGRAHPLRARRGRARPRGSETHWPQRDLATRRQLLVPGRQRSRSTHAGAPHHRLSAQIQACAPVVRRVVGLRQRLPKTSKDRFRPSLKSRTGESVSFAIPCGRQPARRRYGFSPWPARYQRSPQSRDRKENARTPARTPRAGAAGAC